VLETLGDTVPSELGEEVNGILSVPVAVQAGTLHEHVQSEFPISCNTRVAMELTMHKVKIKAKSKCIFDINFNYPNSMCFDLRFLRRNSL
jgi:hypothetical protein